MISAKAIAALETELVIPEELADEDHPFTPLIDLDKDRRRSPRFSCVVNAALRYHGRFPTWRRERKWMRIAVRNVSRHGMGFWHSEPMFPLEQAIIVLPGEIQRAFEVKRCRRIGPSCFEIGGEFDELLDSSSVQQLR